MKAWQAMGFLAAAALAPLARANGQQEALAVTDVPGVKATATAVAPAQPAGSQAAGEAGTSSQIQQLQKQIQELKGRLDQLAADPPAEPAKAAKGALEFYGHLDLSFDVGTKGLSGRVQANGDTPTGDQDWLPAIASNSSFVGVRGWRDFVPDQLKGVFQIEAQVDASATPGPSLVPDNTVKGALAYRNTHVGLAGPWGGLRLGRNDSPYKSSTRRLDPFYGTPGAYTSIMHNTGGDNRAEFDQRFPTRSGTSRRSCPTSRSRSCSRRARTGARTTVAQPTRSRAAREVISRGRPPAAR